MTPKQTTRRAASTRRTVLLGIRHRRSPATSETGIPGRKAAVPAAATAKARLTEPAISRASHGTATTESPAPSEAMKNPRYRRRTCLLARTPAYGWPGKRRVFGGALMDMPAYDPAAGGRGKA